MPLQPKTTLSCRQEYKHIQQTGEETNCAHMTGKKKGPSYREIWILVYYCWFILSGGQLDDIR